MLAKLSPRLKYHFPHFFSTHSYSNSNSYNHLLESCSSLNTLKIIHARILTNGFSQNLTIITKLITISTTLSRTMHYARKLFDEIPQRDVFLWNTLIRGYADIGPCKDMHKDMHLQGLLPDNFTFPLVVRSCGVISALREGKEVHCNVIKNGFDRDVFVQSSLVAMYSQNGEMLDSELVFEGMGVRNIVSWTSMIAGYVQNGFYEDGLRVCLSPCRDFTSLHTLFSCPGTT